MKKCWVFLLIVLCSVKLYAQYEPTHYYVGMNPVAIFTSIPNQYTNLYLPLISNLECGLALCGGGVKGRKIMEGRVSYGAPNALYRLFQVHAGMQYIFTDITKQSWFYCGGMLKYYQLNQRNSIQRNTSLIPYMCVGYRMEKRWYLDIRICQNIYAISWSNQPNTSFHGEFHFSVYRELSPILPYLTVNIGLPLNLLKAEH